MARKTYSETLVTLNDGQPVAVSNVGPKALKRKVYWGEWTDSNGYAIGMMFGSREACLADLLPTDDDALEWTLIQGGDVIVETKEFGVQTIRMHSASLSDVITTDVYSRTLPEVESEQQVAA